MKKLFAALVAFVLAVSPLVHGAGLSGSISPQIGGDMAATFDGGINGRSGSSIPFPGDLASFDLAMGMLYPPTQAACTASRSTPQPAFDVYVVPSSGVFPGSPVTINYTNCLLDTAAILTQQGSTGAFPGNTLASNTLFIYRWYNFGTAGHCTQATQANMPVLTVIDGAPHMIVGTDTGGNNRFLSCPVTFAVNAQFVAGTMQDYGAGADANAASNRAIFYTSGEGNVFGVGLKRPSTSANGSRPAAEATQYRLYNPSLFPGAPGVEQPTGILASSNAVAFTSSSGATTLEVRIGPDSYTNNAFAGFSNLGTALLIGMGSSTTSVAYQGYIDNFYAKASAQNSTFAQAMIAALNQLLPSYNSGVNVVLDGASIPSGLNAISPYIAGNCQGLFAYGFPQAMMGGASARWVNLAVQGSALADITGRFSYAYAAYRSGAKNLYVVNYILGSGAEPATLASNFFAGAPGGQTWTAVVVGTGNPAGDATLAARNATAKAAGTSVPTPGGPGYWWVDGLSQATWNASSFTDAQKYSCDFPGSSHLSPIGATLFKRDALPGLLQAMQ